MDDLLTRVVFIVLPTLVSAALVCDGTSVLVASVDVDVMVIINIIIITIVADGHETRNIVSDNDCVRCDSNETNKCV